MNCIDAVSVDEPLCADAPTNDPLDVNVLEPLIADAPTNDPVLVSVLLELIDAERTKDGDADSVDEPLRLAMPVVVVDGAASLAAIKATVI